VDQKGDGKKSGRDIIAIILYMGEVTEKNNEKFQLG
jgi:hypothetical protein